MASLVFDVPKAARGARGGMLGDDSEGRTVESLFEVHCTLSVAINMGVGTSVIIAWYSVHPSDIFNRKDIQLDLPVSIIHPAALPEPEPYAHPPYMAPYPEPPVAPYLPQQIPHAYPMMTPISAAYMDEAQNQVWLPPPAQNTPQPILQQYPNYSPQMYLENQHRNLHVLSPPPVPVFLPPRPLSAGSAPNSHGHVSYGGIGMGPPPRHPQQLLSVPLGDLDEDTEVQEGKGERAERVTQHLRLSSRHRSVSPQSHRFPLPQPQPSTTQYGRSLPPPPLILLDPSHHTSLGPTEESTQTMVVHSPRPFLSPRRSYSSSTNTSLAKSERVEELERMAEEVKKATEDLSADLPDLALTHGPKPERAAVTEVDLDGKIRVRGGDINKTLPGTPSLTVKDPEEIRGTDWRTRIDAFFSTSVPLPPAPMLTPQLVTKPKTPPTPNGGIPSKLKSTEVVNVKRGLSSDLQAPPTPQAAITPVKMPSRAKAAEFGAQQQHLSFMGGGYSGLDALERRLLADVGTRKMEMRLDDDERRLDVRSMVRPIDIPGRDLGAKKEEEEDGEQPLNDSAISSLALGGEGMGVAAELLGPGLDVEREQEQDGDGDSDEKTHRGGPSRPSSGSVGSRKMKGERGRLRGRKSDEDERDGGKRKKKKKEGKVGTSRKAEAAKGRVAAWLGGIEPEVPPMEEVVPTASVPGKPPFLKNPLIPSAGSSNVGAEDPDGWKDPGQRELKDESTVPTEISSAPNPRSSGFVPIGTLKHDTVQYRRFHAPSKESTIVKEAKHVADLWFSSSPPAVVTRSPMQKAVSPKLPVISSLTQPAQIIGTDKRVSPPSSAPAFDALGAKHYQTNVVKPLATTEIPAIPVTPKKKTVVHQPSPRLPIFPAPRVKQDPEVKYDVRSARGGRGGKVASIASIWGSGGGAEQKSQGKKPAADRRGVVPKPRMKSIAEDPTKNPGEVPSTAPRSQQPFKSEGFNSNDQPKKSSPANPGLKTPRVSMPLKPTLAARIPSVPAFPPHRDLKPVENLGKLARPLVKSASIPVPAIVSSSHATPMLSSTASLARPAAANKVRSAAVRVVTSEIPVQPSISVVKSGDLAFGQARLRDLIKKYQG